MQEREPFLAGFRRDLWVFEKHSDAWVAVWRTMLDLNETPA